MERSTEKLSPVVAVLLCHALTCLPLIPVAAFSFLREVQHGAKVISWPSLLTVVQDSVAVLMGERNNGFDVLYHNMKHGHLSTKELADFIRERATIEEAYSRSMTKLAKSASNYTQLGTFAPVWDVFKTSTEKLASCHLDLVRRLQELIKEVHKYGDEQIKAYKKTKEEVSGTLEAVQSIQSITQALQKSKENYNTKCVEQERLKKEGATQREVDKAAVKLKKATDTYKLYVEKYAAVKSDFEQKMTETARDRV
nr:F-BAR domain only protein 2-like [Dromaius novaehollandiae]